MFDSYIERDQTRGGTTYSVKSADGERWNEWWQSITYDKYRRLGLNDLSRFMVALQDLSLSGVVRDVEFLVQMPEWDREAWIVRAHRQCHKLWEENSEEFPSCGISQSFRQLRDTRKRLATEKKARKAQTVARPISSPD